MSKFYRSVVMNLKTASYLFGVLYHVVFDKENLEFNHLMANVWKKAISFGQEIWIQVLVTLLKLYLLCTQFVHLLTFDFNSRNFFILHSNLIKGYEDQKGQQLCFLSNYKWDILMNAVFWQIFHGVGELMKFDKRRRIIFSDFPLCTY
jgi:hypothetical protein